MRWNGSHPQLTKAQARALYLPGACRSCIYIARVQKRPCLACPYCNSRPARLLTPAEELERRTILTNVSADLSKRSHG
jgi:hypothetical protein